MHKFQMHFQLYTALTGSVNCLVTPGPTLGWPKIIKNVKTENIPLSCEYMDQVEKKRLKEYIVLINIQPALCRLKSLIPLYNTR